MGWTYLGDRDSLAQEIYETTGISLQVLKGQPLSDVDVEERFSWIEKRSTKREEDMAYSLLGLFDIHMPLIYGEGKKKALGRLRKKIEKNQAVSVQQSVHHSPARQSDPPSPDLGYYPPLIRFWEDSPGDSSEIDPDDLHWLRPELGTR